MLEIPDINVSAYVEEVEVTNGVIDTPKNPENVGVYENVLSGHLNLPGGKRGVFASLKDLKRNDEVFFDGQIWTVVGVRRVKNTAKIPTKKYLLLVTCAGWWTGTEYSHRLVVFVRKVYKDKKKGLQRP